MLVSFQIVEHEHHFLAARVAPPVVLACPVLLTVLAHFGVVHRITIGGGVYKGIGVSRVN